jgi:serine/threonine protein kinase
MSTSPQAEDGGRPPIMIGRYRIDGEIGSGGFGVVYRAYDTVFDTPVALKALLPHLLRDSDFVQRFRREARLARLLKHPNVVTVYDIIDEQGSLYIVMELVDGVSLDRLLKDGPLPPERVAAIARQIASALDFAHSHDVVHRDVKPSNILIGPDDHVTLTDFGLARAATASSLTSGQMLGTPGYLCAQAAEARRKAASTESGTSALSSVLSLWRRLYSLVDVQFSLLAPLTVHN